MGRTRGPTRTLPEAEHFRSPRGPNQDAYSTSFPASADRLFRVTNPRSARARPVQSLMPAPTVSSLLSLSLMRA